MKGGTLHLQIIVALVVAVPFGYFLPNETKYVVWMGDLFMRALSMIVMPLIISSIITGVANMGSSGNMGRLGLKTLAYYIFTSLLAILTGLFFVNLFKPGVGAGPIETESSFEYTPPKSFEQILLDAIPDNVFRVMVENETLAVIVFSILFGIFVTRIPQKSQRLIIDFFSAIFEVIMEMTKFLVKLAPFGIFGIVAGVIAKHSDKLGLFFSSLGMYSLVVLIGIFVHFFISLPLLVRLLGGANPYRHMRNVRNALLTAFSTSSSGVTLPLTIEAVENRSGVSPRISKFVLPLGATINMDGTALYECVAAMFIAQLLGVEMSLGMQVIVVVTSLLASIGAASIPMSGFFMLTVVLSAAGLPPEGIQYIVAVDRILDMFRTATNVWSDTCGAVIVAKSEGEKLKV